MRRKSKEKQLRDRRWNEMRPRLLGVLGQREMTVAQLSAAIGRNAHTVNGWMQTLSTPTNDTMDHFEEAFLGDPTNSPK